MYKNLLKIIRKYAIITIAAVIYGVAISLFLDPNNIAPGGITGVAILVNRYTGIETGTLILMINIPIVIIGLWKFGFRFIVSTFYAVFTTSVFTNYFMKFSKITDDLMIAAVLGGVLMAISLAMIFLAGATTGGTDIIVKLLRMYKPHVRTGKLFLLTDFAVVLASWIVFRDIKVAFYAGVCAVVNMVVMDYMLYGGDEAKLIYIISDSPEKIKERIMVDLDITATLLQGKGAYTLKDKEIVMVVLKKQVAPAVQEIVKEEDPNAFMIISSASEIFGEGYKNIKSERI